jgi:hypothetical protein
MEYNQRLKVEGHNNLVRDTVTNGIINTDKSGYETYIKLRKMKERDSVRINKIESDLNSLKNDINDIKSLLLNLSKNN